MDTEPRMRGARSSVGVPPPQDYAKVCGAELAYSDVGSGLPIVCLPAIGHGGGDFLPLRERMGTEIRLVMVDWPGQGCSPEDSQPASAHRYAELLDALLRELGLDRPVLLGNSIGGAAAIQFAAAHPERVRALVLANPGGLAPVDVLTRTFSRLMTAFFRAGSRGARWYGPAFRVYYRLILQGVPAREQRRRIVAACYELAPVLAQAWASFARPDSDLRLLAERVACPVLFTWARRDQIIAYWRSRAAVRSFPNTRVEFFRAGHTAFLEDPDAFETSLREFLGSLPSDPPPVA